MKLVPWLALLHLVAIAIASGVAMAAECDGDKLLAWGLALMVAGWASVLSATANLVLDAVRRRLSIRQVAILVILILAGLYEKNAGTFWYTYIQSLPA